MKTIITVFKKEVKASFREKRTILTVLILPAILFPLLFTAVVKIQKSVMDNNGSKKHKIVLINAPLVEGLHVFDDPKFELVDNLNYNEAITAISSEELAVLVKFDADFEEKIQEMKSAGVSVVYKSTDDQLYKEISEKLEQVNNHFKEQRLAALQINEKLLRPIAISSQNLASKKEMMVEIAGGFLPYMFVIFLFMGCMYPAIDLTTGEKERNTMETLLTVPVPRLHILLGKIISMTMFGLLSAIISILGVFMFVSLAGELPAEISEALDSILTVKFVLLLIGMLIPLAFFFSSILSWLAITANKFKEAQSKIQPVMFMVFLPVMVALMPGIVLDWKTAIIPILNVSLTTKSIMLDAVNYYLYALTVSTLIVLAFGTILISYKRFSNESVVLG